MGTLRSLTNTHQLFLVLTLFLIACSETGGYQVEFQFESDALIGQTAWLRVELADSCEPQTDPATGQVVRNFGSPIPLGAVPPGERHVRAWAYDPACGLVGSGCVSFDAVSGAQVTVTLTVVAAAGPSDCSQCDPSTCDDADSGMRETCSPFEVVCDDLQDGDCDGLTDCEDPDCTDQTCSDDNGCTVGDACVNFECVGTGMECNDDNPCTDNTCVDGACTFVDNSAPCDDGFWCNGADTCGNGSCSLHRNAPCDQFCNETKQTCDQCALDSDCGTQEVGSWTTCQFANTCAINGTRSRVVRTPRCNGGACTLETTTETGSCSRATTDGQSCGSVRYGTWSSCNYANTCDQSASRSRAVYTPRCSSGICQEVQSSQSENCSRSTNGTSCGSVRYGTWSSCSYANACSTTGSRSRAVFTPKCSGGACSEVRTTQTGNCSRTVTNGKSCGGTWLRCCNGTCRDLRTNKYCGGCGIDCTSQGRTCVGSGTGGYQCTCATSNAQCNAIYYGTSNTCYQNRCNCQCPSDGVCRDGGCGSNFYCHDCPGQNFCAPFGGSC